MMKVLKYMSVALIIIFAAVQFIRPARTIPPVEEGRAIQSHIEMPEQVAAILDRSCNDCHSNQTRWPWYSQIAPVSWFVADHVNHGRRHLNFSDWARMNEREAEDMLKEIYEEVARGSMPLGSYMLLHPEARLSDSDREAIRVWTQAERQRLAGKVENGAIAR